MLVMLRMKKTIIEAKNAEAIAANAERVEKVIMIVMMMVEKECGDINNGRGNIK